jgi:uncharacterized membrane protein
MSNPTLQLCFGTLQLQAGCVSPTVLWQLKPNCSITPAQLLQFYATLCIVSLGIGLAFWFQGASLVLPFAGLELLLVGVALVFYARHARDGEKITLQDHQLVIELQTAGRVARSEFFGDWVKVEFKDGSGSLIEVSGQGHSVKVGRFLRPELRHALAAEIRSAVRVSLAQKLEIAVPS